MRQFALAIALALLAIGSASAGALDDIKAHGVLRVGTTGDYRPFSYHAADGSLAGADIELARGLAASLNVAIEFVPTRWQDLLGDFTAHRFDMAVGGISILPARQEKGDFSIALLTDGKRPVARCADRTVYASPEAIDRPGVRVIVNRGGTNESFAMAHFSQATVTIQADNVTVPDEIAAAREDVFVTDGVEADLIGKRFPGVLCPTAVARPFTADSKAWLLPKDPAFKAAVDDYLAGAKSSGAWQQALDRGMTP